MKPVAMMQQASFSSALTPLMDQQTIFCCAAAVYNLGHDKQEKFQFVRNPNAAFSKADASPDPLLLIAANCAFLRLP